MQVKTLRKRSADENRREETGQGNDQEYGEVRSCGRQGKRDGVWGTLHIEHPGEGKLGL